MLLNFRAPEGAQCTVGIEQCFGAQKKSKTSCYEAQLVYCFYSLSQHYTLLAKETSCPSDHQLREKTNLGACPVLVPWQSGADQLRTVGFMSLCLTALLSRATDFSYPGMATWHDLQWEIQQQLNQLTSGSNSELLHKLAISCQEEEVENLPRDDVTEMELFDFIFDFLRSK